MAPTAKMVRSISKILRSGAGYRTDEAFCGFQWGRIS